MESRALRGLRYPCHGGRAQGPSGSPFPVGHSQGGHPQLALPLLSLSCMCKTTGTPQLSASSPGHPARASQSLGIPRSPVSILEGDGGEWGGHRRAEGAEGGGGWRREEEEGEEEEQSPLLLLGRVIPACPAFWGRACRWPRRSFCRLCWCGSGSGSRGVSGRHNPAGKV